jgi:hypothetical protein
MELLISTSNATTSALSAQEEIAVEEEKCVYNQPLFLDERFWLVSVLGTCVALVSVVENVFLFFMLVRK